MGKKLEEAVKFLFLDLWTNLNTFELFVDIALVW